MEDPQEDLLVVTGLVCSSSSSSSSSSSTLLGDLFGVSRSVKCGFLPVLFYTSLFLECVLVYYIVLY